MLLNAVENKSRIYDAGLIVAGSVQAHRLSDIPDNIINSLIEQPIPSFVGLMTFVLVTARVIRMVQKIRRNEKD